MHNAPNVGLENVTHPALTIKCENCGAAVGDECTEGERSSPVRTVKWKPCSRRKLDARKAGADWAPGAKERAFLSDAVRDALQARRYAQALPSLAPGVAVLAELNARGIGVEEFAARKARAVRRVSLRQAP